MGAPWPFRQGGSHHHGRVKLLSSDLEMQTSSLLDTTFSETSVQHKHAFMKANGPAAELAPERSSTTYLLNSPPAFSAEMDKQTFRSDDPSQVNGAELKGVDSVNSAETANGIRNIMPTNEQDDEELFGHCARKRELRPQKKKPGFITTWYDNDETDNYDPKEAARRAKVKRLHQKQLQKGLTSRPPKITNDEGQPKPTPMQTCDSLTVQLQFQSEAGKAAFREHVKRVRTEVCIPVKHDDFTDGYCLRKKGDRKVDRAALISSEDSSDFPKDLTGHPVARGCWACLRLGLHCPLLEDERAWPCYHCCEDECDCELIKPAKRKRTCERCKQKRRPCSYTYARDHSGPCAGCAVEGHSCIAGPNKDAIVTRLRYDRDWKSDPLKPVKTSATLVPCMQCRASGRVCSFAEGDIEEECAACKVEDEICIPGRLGWAQKTPQRTTTAPKTASAPKKRKLLEMDARETPTKRQKVDKSKKPLHSEEKQVPGETKTIDTKLCHPIQFNHDAASDNAQCDFCEHASFALLGLESKEVEVIDWADGRGYDEVSRGHREAGHDPTRICTACTLQRIPVIMCQQHDMRPIAGLKLKDMDVDGAFAALLDGAVRPSDRWCSICPSLAAYECDAEGSTDSFGDPCDGCGLSVCEDCMLTLVADHDGDLQQMLAELKDEPSDERPLGLRADWEFLKQDGLLMRYVLWESQQ